MHCSFQVLGLMNATGLISTLNVISVMNILLCSSYTSVHGKPYPSSILEQVGRAFRTTCGRFEGRGESLLT